MKLTKEMKDLVRDEGDANLQKMQKSSPAPADDDQRDTTVMQGAAASTIIDTTNDMPPQDAVTQQKTSHSSDGATVETDTAAGPRTLEDLETVVKESGRTGLKAGGALHKIKKEKLHVDKYDPRAS